MTFTSIGYVPGDVLFMVALSAIVFACIVLPAAYGLVRRRIRIWRTRRYLRLADRALVGESLITRMRLQYDGNKTPLRMIPTQSRTERVITSPGGSVIYLDRVDGCKDGSHVGYSFGDAPRCMCGAIDFAGQVKK